MIAPAPVALATACMLLVYAHGFGQPNRPRATVDPVAAAVPAAPGSVVAVALAVSLPADVHVQAHEPRDPLLIPTRLEIDAPAGVSVTGVTYPVPDELRQSGRDDSLLVLGPEFRIDVRLAIAPDAELGPRQVPVVLRYQACNSQLCFPPARATAAWTVTVE